MMGADADEDTVDDDDDDDDDDDATTHVTGWARAWLSASMPGISTGYESCWCRCGCWSREGVDEEEEEEAERIVEGKAREDRYVEAVKNRSLAVRPSGKS
jgi:hypothetical protein